MISFISTATNTAALDDDFTLQAYEAILKLARAHYAFVSYDKIPWGSRFLLWRHDVDISLNRALALAKLENNHGISATYFLNPHSEFYNLAEKQQYKLVCEILSLGHSIGLHLDVEFHDDISEDTIGPVINQEADYLESLFRQRPTAFSFHNPTAKHHSFECEFYGGMVNCYSKRLKTEVGYCSDSNGYWRFRRLHDVLLAAENHSLQVLTHPEWWQDMPMPARQRIFRAAYGRASNTMETYDKSLVLHNRVNHSGHASSLALLTGVPKKSHQLYDFLWNSGHFEALFTELWRLHELQVNKLCKAFLRKILRIPAQEVNVFFSTSGLTIDGWRLFSGLFGLSWHEATQTDLKTYQSWKGIRNQLIHARSHIELSTLEDGSVYLCEVISKLATWGKSQSINYDGLEHLGSIGIPTLRNADGRLIESIERSEVLIPQHLIAKWNELKRSFADQTDNID